MNAAQSPAQRQPQRAGAPPVGRGPDPVLAAVTDGCRRAGLSDDQATITVLVIDGVSPQDIATVLDLEVGTVMFKLRTALLRILPGLSIDVRRAVFDRAVEASDVARNGHRAVISVPADIPRPRSVG